MLDDWDVTGIRCVQSDYVCMLVQDGGAKVTRNLQEGMSEESVA